MRGSRFSERGPAPTGADYDLAVIGGGINGVGIARDAAGQGLRVLLVEQGDLASGTSSASSKLVHGGLRYLEHRAFRLVRESLKEREVLLRMAPHLVRPMRFVLPHHAGLRPAWMLRLGLLLYDHLGGRELLPASSRCDLRASALGAPLRPDFTHGFGYSDCWVDDARLVVLNAVDAAERGATIRTRTRCTGAQRRGSNWVLELASRGKTEAVSARALVNAAGPWVTQVAERVLRIPSAVHVRLVRGSHIVVPQLFAHENAYTFQQSDGRVIFAIPFEGAFTLIGTTDVDHSEEPGDAAPAREEVEYLCRAASAYFREPVTPDRVIWSFAGVRPLCDDGAADPQDATRDYVLALDAEPGAAPVVTIYGGKITTYRRLAEAALALLAPSLGPMRKWTAQSPLPGGDFPWNGAAALAQEAVARWPFLSPAQARRMTNAYGTRLPRILANASSADELGPWVGGLLSGAEISYLIRSEWAETADDVLWRRSKLGLHLGPEDHEPVARFMRAKQPELVSAK